MGKKSKKNIESYSNEETKSLTELDKQLFGEFIPKEKGTSKADKNINTDLGTNISNKLVDNISSAIYINN